MDINIKGNPGTQNTFQEIHIGTVQNYNPNATTVVNYFGARGEEAAPAKKKKGPDSIHDMLDQDMISTEPIRKEILNYVSCLRPHVAKDKRDRFMQLWDRILDLPDVEEELYDPGKQQNTNFNRNLVANIIHYLDRFGFYDSIYNAAALTYALEADKEHPIRRALGQYPSAEVADAVKVLVEEFLVG